MKLKLLMDSLVNCSKCSKLSEKQHNFLVFLLHMFDDISTIVVYIVIVKSLYEAKVDKLCYSL